MLYSVKIIAPCLPTKLMPLRVREQDGLRVREQFHNNHWVTEAARKLL